MELFDHKKRKSHIEKQILTLHVGELHNQEMLGGFQNIQIQMSLKKYEQYIQLSLHKILINIILINS